MIDFIFNQYKDYAAVHIILELIAIAAAVASVLYSKNNSVLVYPYGLISTAIFVYLLLQWELPGDMIINAYYFIMSIYGWYNWSSHKGQKEMPVTRVTTHEWMKGVALFLISATGVYGVYIYFEMLSSWINYLDIITTGVAFVGMWLMALRKLEHWLVLLLANLISVPLYFVKGYSFTALLYVFFTIMACIGYYSWKKHHVNKNIAV